MSNEQSVMSLRELALPLLHCFVLGPLPKFVCKVLIRFGKL